MRAVGVRASVRRGLAALLILSALSACNNGSPPPQDLALSGVSPESPTVVQGGSVALTLAFTSQNGFQGQVALSVTENGQAPSWLTLSPTSKSLDVPKGGEARETLEVRVAEDAPTGSHSLKLRVVYGDKTAERDLVLTVSAPPSFALSDPEPNPVPVTLGRTATFRVTLTPQNGFQGEVVLSLAPGEHGVPPGLALLGASPSPVVLSPERPLEVTVTLGASPPVTPSVYRLVLRAQGGGVTQERPLAVEVRPEPSFNLFLSSSALAVEQGKGASVSLTVSPLGGFTGQVDLSLAAGEDPVPQGLNLSPQSVQVAGPSPVTQALTLTASSTTPTGTYRIKVRGVSGSLTREADLAVTVSAPPPSPDFALSLSPSELSVDQGGYGQVTLILTPQNGFVGVVNLSLVDAVGNPPAGIVALGPTRVTVGGGDPVEVSFSFAITRSVPPGTYPLKVRGTSGSLVREADLALTVQAPSSPDFDLALSPQALEVERGGSGQTVLTLTPQNGFTGTVALSLVGAPSGVSLSPTSVQVTGADPVNQTLTLTVAASVNPGTYALKVRGTSGSLSKEADLALTVTAPPPPPDFALSLNPSSLAVQQGGQGQTTLTLTPQNGFTGTVSLSLVPGQDGVPQGLSLSPQSVQVTGSSPVSQALTLTASSSTPTGTYRIKVRGTSGSLSREADLTVTVNAPPPPPTFTLSLNPASLSVQQGGQGQTTLTLTPQNGFTGTVNLSLVAGQDQVPQGLSLSPTSVQVTGAYPVNQTLTVSASSSTPTGTYRIKVRGVAGELTKEADLTVTVSAPLPPGFTLSLNPTSLSLQQGGQGQTTLTLTPQGGFTGQVDLSLVAGEDPVPQGLSLSPTSVQVAGPSSVRQTLTLTASSSTPTGTYRIKVRGASGDLASEAALTVTVNSPSASPDFALSLTSSSLTVQQGGQVQTGLTITPQGGFTGTVSLSLVAGQDQVPQGLSISPTSVQVTGGDPVTQTLTLSTSSSTPTGTYRIKVRGTSGSLVREADLALTVGASQPVRDFSVSVSQSTLTVQQGDQGTNWFTLTPQNPENRLPTYLEVSLLGLPQGVTYSPTSISIPDNRVGPYDRALLVDVSREAPPGSYLLTLRVTAGSLVREASFTLVVEGAPDYDLSLQPESLTLLQGTSGQVTLTVTPRYGFMGRIDLSLVGAPQGVALSPSYVSLSSSTPQSFTLTLSADYSAPAGTYDLRVRGTDSIQGIVKEVPLALTVEAQPQAQEVRIAKVEWGQTLLLENPRLIAQKPALLRVHLVASPGPAWLSAPLAGTAYVGGSLLGNLSFTCPSPIPTSTNQADLATTCNATLPASWVAPGLRVELRADPQDALGGDPASKTLTLTPQVEPGPTLHLTVVPVVHQGVTATVPNFKPTLLAIWPLRDVEHTVRAPYTFSGDLNLYTYDWSQLLDELRLLRQADGSGRYYYGFVRVSYTSSIAGVGYVGYPVAVGWDDPQSASETMAHELGHNFGRRHAPCGTSGDPSYPYADGSIGVWGYDLNSGVLKDPARYYDLMSYCRPRWISDYNYYAAWDFLKANPPSPQSLPTEGLLFSGRIAGGQVVFNPPVRLAADPEGNPSPYVLQVDGKEYPVYVLEDSEGVVHFQAKVPVGPWSRAALYREGRLLAEVQGGVRPQAEPQVDLREEGGFLVVRWTGYPFLSLFHVAQDGTRTALGLWHKGGESRFALEGLPPGGSFEVQLSDGVEVRVLTFPR